MGQVLLNQSDKWRACPSCARQWDGGYSEPLRTEKEWKRVSHRQIPRAAGGGSGCHGHRESRRRDRPAEHSDRETVLNRKVQLAFGSAVAILLVVGTVSYRSILACRDAWYRTS